jgi:hypothetical protein
MQQQCAARFACDIAALQGVTEDAFAIEDFRLRAQFAVLEYTNYDAAGFLLSDCVFCIESFYAKVHGHSSTIPPNYSPE